MYDANLMFYIGSNYLIFKSSQLKKISLGKHFQNGRGREVVHSSINIMRTLATRIKINTFQNFGNEPKTYNNPRRVNSGRIAESWLESELCDIFTYLISILSFSALGYP